MTSKSADDLRLFLGIAAPEKIKSPIADLKAQNDRLQGVRWVPPENLHVTAYFFGNVKEEMLPNLVAMIREGVRDIGSFTLTFRDFYLAPKASQPRMIWTRYHKAEAFRHLVQRITFLYEQIDPHLQTRKSPVPHITIARLKNWRERHYVELGVEVNNPDFTVDELVLWRSKLTPKGAVYSEMARFRLI